LKKDRGEQKKGDTDSGEDEKINLATDPKGRTIKKEIQEKKQ